MNVLCPGCKQNVDLYYLEKKGDQMAYCAKCGTVAAATYKEDRDRLYWEFFFEKPLRKPAKKGKEIGCGWVIVIAIVLFILLAVVCCFCEDSNDRPDPDAGGAVSQLIYGNSQDNNQWTGSNGAERRAFDRSL
jgi:hypothetical protein